MGEYRINTAAPNLTSLCIDHVCNGEYSGRIYHKYQQEAVPFRESSQLISILDSLYIIYIIVFVLPTLIFLKLIGFVVEILPILW